MKIALRAVLSRFELRPVGARPERARRRSITISPEHGCRVVLSDRAGAPAAPPAEPALTASAA